MGTGASPRAQDRQSARTANRHANSVRRYVLPTQKCSRRVDRRRHVREILRSRLFKLTVRRNGVKTVARVLGGRRPRHLAEFFAGVFR